MENRLVKAHLVQIDWPVKQANQNPCSEILLPQNILMEPKQITKLRIMGISVFDVTESLGMDPEVVSKELCYSV